MKKLIIISLTLIISVYSYSQEAKKYTIMYVNHSNSKIDCRITIVYEDGKYEKIDLQRYAAATSKTMVESRIEAQKVVTKVVNDLSKKGYKLLSLNGQYYGGTYIFEKE